MPMPAGKLNHRVTIQERVPESSPTGSVIYSWRDKYENIAAQVAPLSVREFIASGGEVSNVIARITIRYFPELNHNMRILHRGKIYDVAGILPDNVSGLEYITIPVSEGVVYYAEPGYVDSDEEKNLLDIVTNLQMQTR